MLPDLFKHIETPLPTEADFEVEFCENILNANPTQQHLDALLLLGDAYTRKGEYQKGLEVDLKLAVIDPKNQHVQYNLACSYALIGEMDQAIHSLTKAVELGYRDAEHIRNDHDLDGIKNNPDFKSLLNKLTTL
jgi:Flp pilus assembly protein TadD